MKGKRYWRPFQEARKLIRSLGLKNQSDWRVWYKSAARPEDIPANPPIAYKGRGWISWGDWFGTRNRKGGYRSFDDARTFARNFSLTSGTAWEAWAKTAARPDDIPANPAEVYKNKGWTTWGDWLGTNRIAYQNMIHRPFKEARDFARELALKNQAEWIAWARTEERPEDIPVAPNSGYKNKGWKNWGDWLGTRHRKGGHRSFEDARTFVHTLGLQNQASWRIWAKSDKRPDDIPSDAYGVYRSSGWLNWNDWLSIHKRIVVYRPFEEAREFIRGVGLKSKIEWDNWKRSENRPIDIPPNPQEIYKHTGWAGLSDWLGTRENFLSFEDARTIVHSFGLQNQDEWRRWTKNEKHLKSIPAYPDSAYRNKGWKSWGDWLGTGRIATFNMVYRPFEDARIFVHSLGLQNDADWRKWARSKARPVDIPAGPERAYKDAGWISMGDWLGTGRIANQNKVYRSFIEARELVYRLGLKNKIDWNVWAKSDARPIDVPSYPYGVYKNKGWVSWGDWLNSKNRKGGYRPYQEARSFVRNFKIQNQEEWRIWAKTKERPFDIPAGPQKIYQEKGWVSWGDWLGVINRWTNTSIINFLHSIENVLQSLQPSELYAIMRQNGMIASSKTEHQNAPLIKNIRDLCSSPNLEADFEALVAEIEKQNAAFENEEFSSEEEQTSEIIPSDEEAREELPALRSLATLKAVDMLVEAGITSDEETIEFLVANRVSGLWQAALNYELAFDLDTLRIETGGIYFNTIRSRFLTQHDGASNLAIPAGYDFRVDGQLAKPNLMQRLTAYRVLTERRLGNWSGVGAGKTLSAILASRVIDARLTIIVAFNSTVVPWSKRITETYPDSVVHIKERGNLRVDAAKHTYLILNFETFQQPDSAAMVQRLVEKHEIDFVVLDEIQSVKQRTPKITSKRRQVVNGLLSAASEKNPNLCVLGMSATPVINNLYEAKALLELVKGVEFSELNTYSSIANASAMHEKLILYGIRYRPLYSQTIETEFKEIRANEYLSRLKKVRKGAILDLESILLEAKTATLIASLKKGTLVYTHYLTDLITPLRRAIEKAGFKVGLFTGKDKSGLELFKNGKVDVLIGSIPVGTGVDGLQYVCNRMIVVSLPWTSAEYEQLVGRLYRQGSAFDKVEVIIPQVVLEYGSDIWSWDKMRMNRIQYKKTLADAALDGVIPQGELASPDTMFKQAREALQAWIERIEQDGVTFFERTKLRVPLPKETAQIIQRRFGDLSVMNSRFNTAYSRTTHERLAQNPEEWYLYHTLYREARKTWPEIPYEKIAKSLKRRPDWIVGDFGCGEAKLAEALPNKVYSFDHVAINENVTACDIAHTPIDDASLDVAVFSLSLMGLNYADYLKEAYRTLKFGGFLKIAEPVSRWSEKRSALLSTIAEAGFLLVGNVEESNQFLYIDAIKADR